MLNIINIILYFFSLDFSYMFLSFLLFLMIVLEI